jgi:hypothetical protein
MLGRSNWMWSALSILMYIALFSQIGLSQKLSPCAHINLDSIRIEYLHDNEEAAVRSLMSGIRNKCFNYTLRNLTEKILPTLRDYYLPRTAQWDAFKDLIYIIVFDSKQDTEIRGYFATSDLAPKVNEAIEDYNKPATVEVWPETATVALGSTYTFTIYVRNKDGQLLGRVPIEAEIDPKSRGKFNVSSKEFIPTEPGNVTLEVRAGAANPGKANITISDTVEIVPTITSIKPENGYEGHMVIIKGENFDILPKKNMIKFGEISAKTDSGYQNMLYTKVPLGAISGGLTVATSAGIAFSKGKFTVLRIPNKPTLKWAKYTAGATVAAGVAAIVCAIMTNKTWDDYKSDLLKPNSQYDKYLSWHKRSTIAMAFTGVGAVATAILYGKYHYYDKPKYDKATDSIKRQVLITPNSNLNGMTLAWRF